MEGFFKFLFGLAAVIFCLVVIGVFLIILKVVLLFNTEIHLMGLLIS